MSTRVLSADQESYLNRFFYVNNALVYETIVGLSNQKVDLVSIKNSIESMESKLCELTMKASEDILRVKSKIFKDERFSGGKPEAKKIKSKRRSSYEFSED